MPDLEHLRRVQAHDPLLERLTVKLDSDNTPELRQAAAGNRPLRVATVCGEARVWTGCDYTQLAQSLPPNLERFFLNLANGRVVENMLEPLQLEYPRLHTLDFAQLAIGLAEHGRLCPSIWQRFLSKKPNTKEG